MKIKKVMVVTEDNHTHVYEGNGSMQISSENYKGQTPSNLVMISMSIPKDCEE